ncbi:MAG: hypothetical protein FJ304_07370, partial [Planctomycetes bacterium]|nr:hypothetical protein [Planctomycetota bacterium]
MAERNPPVLDVAVTMPHEPSTGAGDETAPHNAAPGAEPLAPGTFPPGLEPRYVPLGVLGSGGMGRVFLVTDTELGRPVALKELRADLATGGWAERFRREARVTGRLQHPGVVPVYDLIRLPDGRTFYTMKPLRGRTLADWVSAFHKHPPTRAAEAREFRALLRAFVDLCRTIGFAHRHGVVHRDLKGANVQVDEFGAVVVLDWGIAKLMGEADDVPALDVGPGDSDNGTATQMGQARGTPLYMAPEQAAGDLARVGPASDIYSLGAVLFEVLCGAHAVARGANAAGTIANVIAGQVGRPRAAAPWVPSALEAVCLKALARDPAARYATADALADDVQRYLDDEAVTVRRAPVAERFARWTRRNRLLVRSAFVGGALALVAVAAVAVLEYFNGIKLDGERKQAVQSADLARQRADEARAATVRANTSAADAKTESTRANKNAADAKAAGQLAASKAQEAQDALRSSLRAIDEALVKLAEDRFRGLPGLQPINKELLERASAGCDALLKIAPDDAAVLAELGRVRLHLAEVAAELEGEQYAIEVLTQSLAFQKRRAATADPRARLDHSVTHLLLGVRRARAGNKDAAGTELNAALDIQQALLADTGVKADPALKAACQAQLGRTLMQIARWQAENTRDERATFRAISASVENLEAAYLAERTSADYALFLGQGLVEAGLLARAFKNLALARDSLATARRVLSEAPPDVAARPRVRQMLGNAFNLAHLVETESARPAEALALLKTAVEIRTNLVRENPAVITYKADLASALSNLGTHERRAGRLVAAADLYDTAFAALEQACAVNPNLQAYRSMRNAIGYSLGDVLLADKRYADAARAFEAVRPHLVSPNDYVLIGGGLARAAAGLRGGDEVPTG